MFSVNLLTANHVDILSNTLHIILSHNFQVSLSLKMFVSFAKSIYFTSLDMLHISFTYIINSLGPKIEPWGTLHDTLRTSDLQVSTQIMFYWVDNYLAFCTNAFLIYEDTYRIHVYILRLAYSIN